MTKKKSAKQREYSLQEIYDSYYRLILNIEPFAEGFLNYYEIPAIVQAIYEEKVEEFKSKHPSAEEDELPRRLDNLDGYLQWHVQGGIPLLHTKDGQSITSLVDIRRLWQSAGLSSGGILEHADNIGAGYEDEIEKLSAYLSGEHTANLKGLETPAPQAGQSGKASFSTIERIVAFLGSLATTIASLIRFVYWLIKGL